MLDLSLICLVIVIAFFVIYFVHTQPIYSKNRFRYFFPLSISIPFLLFIFIDDSKTTDAVNLGLLLFYYIFLLWLIKINYSNLNAFLIRKKLVDKSFAGKDFTFSVHSEYGDDIWDNEFSLEPSGLDKWLSFLLLICPLLLITVGSYLTDFF